MLELEKQPADYLAAEQYPEAITAYEQAIADDPSVISNYWYLGLAYLLQGQNAEAEATWLAGIAKGNADETTERQAELIQILITEASKKATIFDYEQAITIRLYVQKLESGNINNLLCLIWLYIETNQFQPHGQKILCQATEVLLSSEQANQNVNSELLWRVIESVIEINPYDMFVEVGLNCPKLDNESEPVKKIKEKYFNLSVNLGLSLLQQQSFAAAFQQFKKTLNIKANIPDTKQAEILYWEGVCQYRQRKFPEAIALFEASLKLAPNFAAAANELSKAKYRQQANLKGYQFTQDWFSRNIPSFQKNLARYVNISEIKALEIGSWEGRSTCWLLENILIHPTAEITCVDTFQGSVEHKLWFPQNYIQSIEERFDFNIALTNSAHKVKKIVGSSIEVMRCLPLNTYDFIYIDGSHLAYDVLADAVLAWQLLKEGGLMIFDDYDFLVPNQPQQNTKIGIDAFLTVFGDKLKVIHREYQVIVEKICS